VSDESLERLALVTPHFPLTSRGGRYDDDAFVAGYVVASINHTLMMGCTSDLDWAVEAELRHTLDMLAMAYGYQALFDECARPGHLTVRFVRELAA
jgi:hypothetical protein